MKTNWTDYFKAHAKRDPRPQLVRAVEFCINKDDALDLGAGTLIESIYLLSIGFKIVTAVDSEPMSIEIAREINSEQLQLVSKSFQEFDFVSNSYDLINAQFALPFHGPENFNQFIQDITNSLKTGGIFVGQFFGTKDSWNTADTTIAFHTKEQVDSFLEPYEILGFKEVENDSPQASGDIKHWHIFNFIARKK